MIRFARISSVCCLLYLLRLLPAVGQETSDDEPDLYIDAPDNPTGRAEYERLKRADPATGRVPDNMRRRELEFAAGIPSRESLVRGGDGKEEELLRIVPVWHERGPINQGGRTRALAVDRTNERILLAGGVSGGLWRSEDVGATWVRVTAIDQIHSVTCLRQDPRPGAGNTWYYGTGEWRANSADLPGDGIFKSTDGGRSWNRLASTVRNTPQRRDQVFDYIHRIEVDPSNLDEDEIYAACYGGIARSTDGGETWQTVLGDLNNNAPYSDIAVTSAGVLYATLSSNGRNRRGIWRSEDGVNWIQITPPNFPTNYNKISIGVAPSNEKIIYFFGDTPGAGRNDHSLWVYEDNNSGPTVWENRSGALPGDVESYSSYCLAVRVKPDDENVVFLGHYSFHRSTNGFRDTLGVSFHMGEGQHADQHEFVFFPSDPNKILAGHDGGLSLAQNNMAVQINWRSLNNQFVTTQFYTIAIDHAVDGSQMIIGGTQDNGTWFINNDDELARWQKVFGADGGYCAIADSGKDFYMSYQNGAIFRNALDSAGYSQGVVRVDPEGVNTTLFIHPFALDPSDTRIMYLPEGRNIWRNSDLTGIPLDAGQGRKTINWTRLDSVQIPEGVGNLTAVGVSRRNPAHRLYYGTARGRVYRLDNADTAQKGRVDISGNYFPVGYVQSIAVDPHDGNNVLVAISSYNMHSLFFTTDGGETWDTVGGNLEEEPNGQGNGPSVGWVAILPVGGGNLYFAGTTTGLYSATALNGMHTFWAQEGASTIGNIVVDMVDVRQDDGFVAVGSHGRGVFSGNVLPAYVGATLAATPSVLDFGGVPIKTAMLDTVTLTNPSSSARSLYITVPQVDEPFSVISGVGSVLLAPGVSHQVIVRFSPDSLKLYSEPLQLLHDGTEPQNPLTIWLTGEGTSTTSVAEKNDEREGATIASYPNPFAQRVDLRLSLSTGANVSLTILAADGKEVARLHEGRMDEGTHTITWTPHNLANGLYFVRLQAGEERVTLPVVKGVASRK